MDLISESNQPKINYVVSDKLQNMLTLAKFSFTDKFGNSWELFKNIWDTSSQKPGISKIMAQKISS